jgi:hypothetical protein
MIWKTKQPNKRISKDCTPVGAYAIRPYANPPERIQSESEVEKKITVKIKQTRRAWLIPASLLLLSVVPVVAGVMRIVGLAGGADITPENARFFAAPLPVVLHIIAASLYATVGVFQFVLRFRRWRPGWHRAAGRLLVVCGLTVAFSGLWMTLFYPWPVGDGELLYGLRLIFGSAMALSILLGVTAIQRRDFVQHGVWMLRGYAIGMGAGTQLFTHLPWMLFFGTPDEFTRAMLMAAGWLINLAVAEWIIHRRLTYPIRTAALAVKAI